MNHSKYCWQTLALLAGILFLISVPVESLFARQAVPGESNQQRTAETEQQEDQAIIRTDQFSLEPGSLLQLRYTYLAPDQEPENGSFSIRRARLSLQGDAYDYFNYKMQLELAGSSVNLLDANISYQLAPMAVIWAGQGKIAFGRQQLTSSGNLQFVDRSIVNSRFTAGRQTGMAVKGKNEDETFEYAIGIYNGNGINTSNNNNRYMKVARVVFTPLGAYSPSEGALDYPDTPRFALGFAGLHTTMTTGSDIENDIFRLNVEGAFKIGGFSLTTEFFMEEFGPDTGQQLSTTGWYSQAGFLLPDRNNEIVARYGRVSPDLPGSVDAIETGIAWNYYINRHNVKLQADLRNVHSGLTETNDLEFRVQLQISF